MGVVPWRLRDGARSVRTMTNQPVPAGPRRIRRAVRTGALASLAAIQAGLAGTESPFSAARRAAPDDSEQPYGLCVPAAYDGQTALPLIVVLRDAGPGGTAPHANELGRYARAFSALAETNECMVCVPAGRGGEIATDLGARDVLDTVAEISGRYRIDPDRVSLLGYGLGAVAAWRLACFNPDRWAALALVERSSPPPAPRDDRLDRMLPGTEPDLLDYAGNLIHVPVRIHLAKDGPRSAGLDLAAAAARLQELNYAVERVDRESLPTAGSAESVEPGVFRWLLRHARSRCPATVAMRAPCASWGKAYWAEILRFEDPARPAEIRATVSGSGGMVVECRNVLRFALDLDAGQYPHDAFVDVIVNQYDNPVMCPRPRRYVIGPVGAHPWLWKEDTNAPAGPVKRAGLEGPMNRVFSSDFALVAGSSDPDTNRAAAARRITTEFSAAWRARYGAEPVTADDSTLPDSTAAGRSLVVIGRPDTNSPLFKIVSALPVRVAGEEAVAVGGKRIEGRDIGFACVYPNPAAPGRLVLVLGATSASALEQVPRAGTFGRDYEVFRIAADGAVETVAAGVFDSNWSVPSRDSQPASREPHP
jgi:pimeloyl-ACP methyl ester carboxylesterase